MMSISIADLRALTWWEYQALLWNWADRHPRPDEEDEPIEAPDAGFVMKRQAHLERMGIAKVVH